MKDARIPVGVSACLLGQTVRYDGGHKKDPFVAEWLDKYFEWVPVCPELEVGMGVPREAVRLTGTPESPRMVGRASGRDWTHAMIQYSRQKVRELESRRLCGFIFKSKSPSCGMERVKVHSENNATAKNGIGLFAGSFLKAHPSIPAEEEGRLNDPRIRENFIVRVFSCHRWQNLMDQKFRRSNLIEFHTANKYLILAHSPQHYARLGKLVAGAKSYPASELLALYGSLFMEALARKTTVAKNVNVLQHILGFLRESLTSDEKRDILDVISEYHRELVPLVVPLTLLRHYVHKHNIEYIKNQIYLNPHPKELMLRNHV